MTDPFDALRETVRPAEPDPRFAAELHERLQRAVLDRATNPTGGAMTSTETPAQAGLHALTPYLAVTDARRALEFYVEVFGATRRADPIVMADGRIGHAELAIGDAVLMLADEFADIGAVASPGGASIRIEVPNVEDVVNRAVERGAELIRPVADAGYGLSGTIRDPFGQRWMVAQAPQRSPRDTEATAADPRHGEAGYFTLQVQPGWKLMYAVDDLEAARARVREQGGQAGAVEQLPYGRTADCVDNQGIEFWLWQPPRD